MGPNFNSDIFSRWIQLILYIFIFMNNLYIYNTKKQGMKGFEAVPHHEFWIQLP